MITRKVNRNIRYSNMCENAQMALVSHQLNQLSLGFQHIILLIKSAAVAPSDNGRDLRVEGQIKPKQGLYFV